MGLFRGGLSSVIYSGNARPDIAAGVCRSKTFSQIVGDIIGTIVASRERTRY